MLLLLATESAQFELKRRSRKEEERQEDMTQIPSKNKDQNTVNTEIFVVKIFS